MNKTGQVIVKNASVLFASQIITWALTLLLTIFLPRFLGPAAVGQFHLANSLWAVVAIVATFGMDVLLVKETARAPGRAAELFGTTLVLRSLLYLLGAGFLVLYTWIAGYEAETLQVIAVVGIANLIVQMTGACEALLKGVERMEFISYGNIAAKTLLTVLSIALLLLGQSVVAIAAVGIVAALVNLLLQLRYLRRLQLLTFSFQWGLARWMLRASFPYLLVYAFLVLYMQVDIVIISLLVNEEGVGWYGAADQLFGTLLFIPTVFMTAVFPALSRLYTSASESLPRLMSRSFDLLLLVSVPIGFGIIVIADSLVVLLFGPAFANSGPILAVMGLVLILTYQNMLISQFVISTDRQNVWTGIMVAAVLASIPLDLLLIPLCQQLFNNGAIGGALAFIVTELGMLLVGLRYLPQGALDSNNGRLALRVLLAGMMMVAAIWWMRGWASGWLLAYPILVGAAVYVTAVLALRVVSAEERELFRQLAQNVLLRVRRQRTQPVG